MRQTVIVTGASRGLGAATAVAAADLGANLVLTARSADDLAETARRVEAHGGQAQVVAGDIRDPAVHAQIVAQALEAYGRVDALVNNAGILEPLARLADAEREEWERNWQINVLGPLLLIQAALPELRRSRGRVLNVSSGAALKGYAGWGAYCVAKGALNQLNRVLAEEEAEVTAVAFRPGVVDTAMQSVIRQEGDSSMTPEMHGRFRRLHREGELLPPEVPGSALAVLALHAPSEWSGEFIQWDEARVQQLVLQHGSAQSHAPG